MERDQLIGLARRAVKLARDNATDLLPDEYSVAAADYTSRACHERDVAMLVDSPQLVGYSSELTAQPGSFCTKTVMGREILLTRAKAGTVKAFYNSCAHRHSRIASGCGVSQRLVCPYHGWTYSMDGRLVGVPGRQGFSESRLESAQLIELPAADHAGFLWLRLTPGAELDVAEHLGPLDGEMRSWAEQVSRPVGERVLDVGINWKLAIDTFAENYHFATVHKTTFAKISRSNCTVFDAVGPHHRLVFPFHNILELDAIDEDDWQPLQNMSIIYALFPNVVVSVTPANGELFRIYPGDGPGRSVTFHQNSTPLDLSDPNAATFAHAAFDYAHATVRDEDYALVAHLQQNLESGVRQTLTFGRNEPGLQHRHVHWSRAATRVSARHPRRGDT